jgi:hypothetical protein
MANPEVRERVRQRTRVALEHAEGERLAVIRALWRALTKRSRQQLFAEFAVGLTRE